MTSTIYLDTVKKVACASITGTAQPSVPAKLLAHLKLIIKFFGADGVIAVDADTPTCVIKPKLAPTGAPSLIDTTAVRTGTGATSQYVFEWASADSTALRAVMDATGDPTQPVELRCEVEYELDGNLERIAFPIYFDTSYTRPEDPAPEANTDSSWEWLKLRAPEANGFSHDDVERELTVAGGGGSGDVVGPASSVDSRPALFDGTTGKLLKQGTAALGDAAYKNTGSTAGTLAAGDDARMTNARTPTAHASTHLTGGADAIQAATAAQPGLATAAQITKLDGIETGADVTDAANVAAAGAAMKSVYDSQNLGLITGLQGSGEIIGPGAFSGGSGGQLNMAGGNGGEFTGGSAGSINTSGGAGSGVYSAGGSGGNIWTHGGDDGRSGGNIYTNTGGGSIDTSNGGGSIATGGTGLIELGNHATRTTFLGTATEPRTVSLPDASGTIMVLNGALPIANGGTGQTTAVAAFDALAPTTTKGDLIVSNGTDNIRVAVGATNGHVLTVDSAQASGVKWAAASGGSAPLFASKTDTETLNATTWTDIAGLSLSFTAASITQKISVRACLNAGNNTAAVTGFRLVNEDGVLLQAASPGSRLQCHAFIYTNAASITQPVTFEVVYTPGTTFARTYKVQWIRQGTGAIYINRTSTDTDNASFPRTASTLFLQAF